jgi:hypothetical protein
MINIRPVRSQELGEKRSTASRLAALPSDPKNPQRFHDYGRSISLKSPQT